MSSWVNIWEIRVHIANHAMRTPVSGVWHKWINLGKVIWNNGSQTISVLALHEVAGLLSTCHIYFLFQVGCDLQHHAILDVMWHVTTKQSLNHVASGSHSRSTIVKALMGEDASSGNALELARAHNALVLKNMGGRVCGPSGGKVFFLWAARFI